MSSMLFFASCNERNASFALSSFAAAPTPPSVISTSAAMPYRLIVPTAICEKVVVQVVQESFA
jgi:hypothetical protein